MITFTTKLDDKVSSTNPRIQATNGQKAYTAVSVWAEIEILNGAAFNGTQNKIIPK